MTVWDLIVQIRGDSAQFREDMEQDRATLDTLFAMLNDKQLAIDLDDTDAEIKIEELKAKLDDFLNKTVDIKIDDEKAKLKVDELRQKMRNLRDAEIGIKFEDGLAKADLDEFRLKLKELRDAWIKIHVENAEADLAIDHTHEKLDALPNRKDVKINADTKNAQGNVMSLGNIIMALLPLASPVAANIIGGAGGIASAFTSAGLATAGFGAVADYNLKQVSKAQKTLQTDITNVNKAQQAVGKAKTYQQWLQATLNLSKANQQLAKDEKSLGPAMTGAVNSLNSFESFWRNFAKSFQPQVFKFMQTGFQIIEKILVDMRPAINAAAKAFNGLLDDLNRNMDSAPVKQFFNYIGQTAGPLITEFGKSAGNILKGFMALMRGFAPLALSMGKGFENMTANWAKWAQSFVQSDKFKEFIAYVEKNGPTMLDVLKQAIDLITNFLVAVAPIGQAMLDALDGMLRWINSITEAHPWILTLVGVIIQLIAIFKMLWPVLRMVIEFFKNIPETIDAVIQFFVRFGKYVTTVIDAIVSAFEWLMGILEAVGEFIAGVMAVIGEVIALPEEAIVGLVAAVAAGVAWIVYHWNWLSSQTMAVFHGMMDFLNRTWASVQSGIASAWNGITSTLGSWATSAWNAIKNAFSSVGSWFAGLWHSITKGISSAWNGITSTLGKWAKDAWNAITGVFKSIGDWFAGLWHGITTGISNAWNSITTTLGRWAHDAVHAVENVFNSIGNFFKNLWNEAYQWGSNLIHMIGKGISDAASSVTNAVGGVASKIKSLLGFHSPTEEGPASDSDTWMPNMMKMFKKGIDDNLPMVHDSLSKVFVSPNVSGMMANARAYGSALAQGVAGGLTVHAPLTIQGNVYSSDDLQGMMNAHLQSNILPTLNNLLTQPARTLGIKET